MNHDLYFRCFEEPRPRLWKLLNFVNIYFLVVVSTSIYFIVHDRLTGKD